LRLVDDLAEDRGGDVQVDTTGTAGRGRAQRPRHPSSDVLGAVDPVGGLREVLRRGELVQLLVVAALEIDDVPLA